MIPQLCIPPPLMWEKHWFSFAELALPHYYFLSFGYSWAQVQLQGDTHFPRQVSYQILPLLATVFAREYFLTIHNGPFTLNPGTSAGLIRKEKLYWDNRSTVNLGLLGTWDNSKTDRCRQQETPKDSNLLKTELSTFQHNGDSLLNFGVKKEFNFLL